MKPLAERIVERAQEAARNAEKEQAPILNTQAQAEADLLQKAERDGWAKMPTFEKRVKGAAKDGTIKSESKEDREAREQAEKEEADAQRAEDEAALAAETAARKAGTSAVNPFGVAANGAPADAVVQAAKTKATK